MNFQAYCPECRKTVTAMPMLGGEQLRRALSSKQEVKVMHTVTAPARMDHYWNLSDQEKRNLRNTITNG